MCAKKTPAKSKFFIKRQWNWRMWTKKPLARKQIFVQTQFSHSILGLEKFTPKNDSIFCFDSGFGRDQKQQKENRKKHFHWKYLQNVEMQLCNQNCFFLYTSHPQNTPQRSIKQQLKIAENEKLKINFKFYKLVQWKTPCLAFNLHLTAAIPIEQLFRKDWLR